MCTISCTLQLVSSTMVTKFSSSGYLAAVHVTEMQFFSSVYTYVYTGTAHVYIVCTHSCTHSVLLYRDKVQLCVHPPCSTTVWPTAWPTAWPTQCRWVCTNIPLNTKFRCYGRNKHFWSVRGCTAQFYLQLSNDYIRSMVEDCILVCIDLYISA